jgi:hypothetical protein
MSVLQEKPVNSLPRIVFGALLALASTASAETLVYEREFSMIAEDDNTLRIELTPDGRLTVERPVFMTRSGRYELQVDPAEYTRLRAAFEAAYTDSDRLHYDVQFKSSRDQIFVTDPEYSRFAVVDDERRPVRLVAAVSVEAWAETIDDVRLQRLQKLQDDWAALMDAKVSEVAR